MGWENCGRQSMLVPLFSVFVLPLSWPFCHACLYSRPHKYKQVCLLIFLCLLIIGGGVYPHPPCTAHRPVGERRPGPLRALDERFYSLSCACVCWLADATEPHVTPPPPPAHGCRGWAMGVRVPWQPSPNPQNEGGCWPHVPCRAGATNQSTCSGRSAGTAHGDQVVRNDSHAPRRADPPHKALLGGNKHHSPGAGGGGGARWVCVRGQKQVCVPKVTLQSGVPSTNFRKVFLPRVSGWLGWGVVRQTQTRADPDNPRNIRCRASAATARQHSALVWFAVREQQGTTLMSAGQLIAIELQVWHEARTGLCLVAG